MYNKDGSLDKRFKENKGLKNFNLGEELAELHKIQQENKAREAEERLIEKTKNNFLKRSDSGEIINKISDLTSYFLLYSSPMAEKQKLLWFDENYNFKKFISFPSNFCRWVIDSYFDGSIKWKSYEIDEQEHSIFKKKYAQFSSLILRLTEVEVSTFLEQTEIDEQKAKTELAKKPRMIETFGYCYNYDKNPLDESKFKQIRADYDTILDFMYIEIDIYEYNICLKHLTNKELTDLEEYNRIDEGFFIKDELNESIQLERQRRNELNIGGFIKNIFSSIQLERQRRNELNIGGFIKNIFSSIFKK